jgi:hypothetical protein
LDVDVPKLISDFFGGVSEIILSDDFCVSDLGLRVDFEVDALDDDVCVFDVGVMVESEGEELLDDVVTKLSVDCLDLLGLGDSLALFELFLFLFPLPPIITTEKKCICMGKYLMKYLMFVVFVDVKSLM